jgi:hypothetical protein
MSLRTLVRRLVVEEELFKAKAVNEVKGFRRRVV